jgi:hypothetical protein
METTIRLAYARPALVRCGSAVVKTRATPLPGTFDGGTGTLTKKGETGNSAQTTDAGTTTNVQ